MNANMKKKLNRIANAALWLIRIAVYIAILWVCIHLFLVLTAKCHTGQIIVFAVFLLCPVLAIVTMLLSSANWFGCHVLHTYQGCQCVGCRKKRAITHPSHQWQGCRCQVCGLVRSDHHQWINCKCSVCGRVRNEAHLWDPSGCVCTYCGKEAHEWQVIRETPAMEECCNAPGCECTHCNNCTLGPVSIGGHGEYRCAKCGQVKIE